MNKCQVWIEESILIWRNRATLQASRCWVMENNSAVMDGVLSDELFPLSVHGAVCVSCQSASNWFKMFFKRSDMLHLFRSGLDLCTPNKPKHISLVEQPTWLVLVKFIVITLNPAFTVTSDGFIFCARDKQERGFLRKTELFEIPLKLGMTLFKRKEKKKGAVTLGVSACEISMDFHLLTLETRSFIWRSFAVLQSSSLANSDIGVRITWRPVTSSENPRFREYRLKWCRTFPL